MRWAAAARGTRPVRFAVLPIGAIKLHGAASGNHIDPVEALGVHWGTFELTSEGTNGPSGLLKATLAANRIDAARFRTIESGQSWDIPPLR